MEAEKQQYQTKYNSAPSLNIRDKILNSMVVILYYSYVYNPIFYRTKYNRVPSLNIRDSILNFMVIFLYYS